ncbi:dTDP-4-dehydrorhamnose reductase [Flavobacterium sp. CYK-55]|uniref:dTDP-4-dehydrorhamnose reductase n=1 Tax=Flavobacterium sp. CYK-55 TaxID=2835529 RepID=UPI001BD11231|nr:dTDP-4-dehydrorhamnose reductase [Flavobacterium sp. CYK-55]MBS7786171.1 dTDP-4-dehydrorhamnose reductase [Flavobacterium sp. CYK-55]
MVIAVTGASGQLGQAILKISTQFPEHQFFFYNSAEVDITQKILIEKKWSEINPDYCINAAAYTAVDKAESEIELAYQINETGVKNLAEVCQKFQTTLIHISTDFVFDGKQSKPYSETDQTNPKGVYGASKLAGEQAIAAVCKKYFIVRTSWLYSSFGHNFLKTMCRLAAEKPEVRVVNDQIGSPTHALDLAQMLLNIINQPTAHYGIYHFSNQGSTSWFGFAQKIFEVYQLKTPLLPITTKDFPTPAKRPKFSVMDSTKIQKEFTYNIPKWEESLVKYKE